MLARRRAQPVNRERTRLSCELADRNDRAQSDEPVEQRFHYAPAFFFRAN